MAFLLVSLAVVALLAFLLRDIWGPLVVALFLATLFVPVVDLLHRFHVSRGLAVLLIYLVLGALVWGLELLLAPAIVAQALQLSRTLPDVSGQLANLYVGLEHHGTVRLLGYRINVEQSLASLHVSVANILMGGQVGNVVNLGLGLFGMLFQIFLALLLCFFFTKDSQRIAALARGLVPVAYRGQFDRIWSDMGVMLLHYLRGQLIICVIIGLAAGLTLWLLRVPYPLALGVVAAITAIVPYLGPFLGAVPAIISAALMHPFSLVRVLLVAVAYTLISNIILNFVYPKVVGDAVRVSPLLVVLAFLSGYSLAGLVGMFIAVPAVAAIKIIYDHLHPVVYALDVDGSGTV